MLVTRIIGLTIFTISCLLSLLIVFGIIFKKVGVSSLGTLPVLLLVLGPCGCLRIEFAIFTYSPYAWGINYIFIVANLMCILMQYMLVLDSAIFTENSIYRLTKYLTWKKHSYDDVIGYVMKTSSGPLKVFGEYVNVITYDVEIYFSNNKYVEFSVKDQKNRKVAYIKRLLEEHHCRRNGRPKPAKHPSHK